MPKLPQFYDGRAAVSSLPPDRVFAAGLLETMRCQNGAVPLWLRHRDRLARSGLVTDAELAGIGEFVRSVAAQYPDGATKLRLRYGNRDGRRAWDLSLLALEPTPELLSGARLYPCTTRLAIEESANPGCKTLQRTRYNRAKSEVSLGSGSDWDGLMLDTDNRVIETLRCNVLLWSGSDWLTPDLHRCGVRGVMREWLGSHIPLREMDMDLKTLGGARELAICNSVRGVIPVRELIGYKHWAPGPETRRLQQLIAEELW